MDILVTRKHPTPTQRLLINLLDSEKAHIDTLLLSLSRVHSANAALAAYAGAGRDQPLSLAMGGVVGVLEEEAHPRMQAYANTLSQTRLGLKEIRDAEESLANITRDRDILVQRMIKQTKKKPSKSELRSSSLNAAPSRNGSLPSSSSIGSFDKTGKLEEAQLELSGCEDALRKEEARLEEVRRRVLRECVEMRLEAMEAAGRSWMEGAKRAGVEIMTYLSEGAPFEHHIPAHLKKSYQGSIESTTPSLAPSQSASQIGRDDDPSGSENGLSALGLHQQQYANDPPGSLASVLESDGSSSDAGTTRNIQVVENARPNGVPSKPESVSPSSPLRTNAPRNPPQAPSSTWNSRTIAKPSPKAASKAAPKASYGGSDSDSSDAGTLRNSSSRRRTQSDVGNNRSGGGGIGRRAPLARRASNASSVSSGARSEGSIAGGKKKKKGGFFGALKHLFAPRDKESLKRGSTRAASPDSLQHHSSSWSTRTDRNVRRAGGGSEVGTSASGGGGLSWGRKSKASGGRDDSSDDEDVSRAALIAVTNVGRTAGKKDASDRAGDWVVEPVGGRPGIKRSSSSRSTIKGKDTSSAVDKSKKRQSMIEVSPSTGKSLNGTSTLQKPKPTAASEVTSSKALKSTQSNGTLKSKKSGSDLGPAKTALSGVKRSTSTSAVPAGKKAVNGKPAAPPAVPTLVSITAPRSLNPSSRLSLPSAPGSSIVPATLSVPQPLRAPSPASPPAADSGIKRSSTYSAGTNSRPLSAISTAKAENFHHSPQHRTASPPPRSALRQPRSATELKPSLLGSVPILSVPTAPSSRLIPSPTPTTGDDNDNESIYETGVEDNAEDDGNETEHEREPERSNVLLGKQLDGLSPVHVVSPPGSNVSNLSSSNGTAILSNGAGSDVKLSRRKSVRIEGVPPSPASESPPRLPRPGNYVPPPEVSYDDTGAPVSANHGPSSWSSRIPSAEGGVWGGVDSSDEDPDEGEYAAAKRAMERAARKAEKAKAKGKARQEA